MNSKQLQTISLNTSLTLLLLVPTLLVGCASPRYQGPKSDHFDGKKFFNPGVPQVTKGLWQVLKWKWTTEMAKWPDQLEAGPPAALPSEVPAGHAHVTFVNHATVLVQTKDFNFLMDPIWSKRASPLSWIGPARVRPPGVDFEHLPRIDAVFVSHNHYDHLDLPTLKRLEQKFKPRFFVALGDRKLLESEGIRNVVEMDWWQKEALDGVEITFLPAQHWSARGIFDRNESLWGSYGFQIQGQKIYFGGDSGYGPHYQQIRERWHSPDFAILPIGAYEPRWFMKEQHMNPQDAVQAAKDLGAKKSMGIHYGTWQLTNEGIDEPAKALAEARKASGLSEEQFFILPEGGSKRL